MVCDHILSDRHRVISRVHGDEVGSRRLWESTLQKLLGKRFEYEGYSLHKENGVESAQGGTYSATPCWRNDNLDT